MHIFLSRLLPLLGAATSVQAAGQSAPASAGSLFEVLPGLIIVLGLLAAATWLIRRLGLSKTASAPTVKIIGGINVGNRERILVVEVADQWIVVGVAPGRINALSTMERQEVVVQPEPPSDDAKNFSAWLKQIIEKRNAQ